MAEGFPDPIARVPMLSPDAPVDSDVAQGWPTVQSVLVAWMAKGCAQVLKDGVVMDPITLAAVSIKDLRGCELVIFHDHVQQRFPWLLHRP